MTVPPSIEAYAEHRSLSARLPHLLRIGLLARQLQCAEPWSPESLALALQEVQRTCSMQKRAGSTKPWRDSGMLQLARTLLQPASTRHGDVERRVAELQREIRAVRAAFDSLDAAIAQARVELEREAACLVMQLHAPEPQAAVNVGDRDNAAASLRHAPSADRERAGTRAPAHMSSSLITIAAQSRILAKAIAAIARARMEFVRELEGLVKLANTPFDRASGSSSLLAFLGIGRWGEQLHMQAIAVRVRQLERRCVVHAAREAAFRQSCIRIQAAVENHVNELRLDA